MATLTVVQPKIIQMEFRQEKGDQDYGCCMWATFRIDTESYDLMIMSDCGNYAYGWSITPTESFLHLLSRLDEGYLLEKLSRRTDVNTKATLAAIKELIDDFVAEEDAQPDLDEIKSACENFSEDAVIDGLLEAFMDNEMQNCDASDIYSCIEMDYPAGAKKIVEIFEKFIAPKCKELEGIDGTPND